MVEIVVVLVVVGVVLSLMNTIIPLDSRIKTVINVLVVLMVGVWLLQVFGLVGTLRAPLLF